MKSGNLSFLESSGPLQACNGTALTLLQHTVTVSCSQEYVLMGYGAVLLDLKCQCHFATRPEKAVQMYRSADKSLARPTSPCILFDGENISFDTSPVIHTNSTNIPPIMIINRIYEHQNLLSL